MKSSLTPKTLSWAVVMLVVAAEPLLAYVGPGSGITMLAALWAVLVAVFFALVGILTWPIRTLLRKRKKDRAMDTEAAG